MKRLLMSLVAASIALGTAGAAEAQRWHGGYHHGWHRGWGHGPYYRHRYYGYHRRYWRHGRRW